jgi:predicted metal-dependent phosphoesterase TrpH
MDRLRLDLHVHSRHSPDSALTVEAIASRLAAVGLSGFALTDHNSVAGHPELGAVWARFPQFVFVPGVEVSTVEGHLLAYGVSEAPPAQRPVAETIDWVRDHGGVPVLSHPFRFTHGVGRVVAETAQVPTIETVNGHNSPRANRKAADVARRRGLGGTGGSDVHELADLGRAYTEFPEGTTGIESILDALRAGRTSAGGLSLDFPGRVRLEWRTTVSRVRRGFRPI